MNKEDLYKDHQGYYRFKDSNKLVHRWVAYKHIYLKDRKKYPLEFKEYQVHHIDGNKENNKEENLQLITIREHEQNHNIYRYEYPIMLTLFIFLVVVLSWFIYLGRVTNYKYDLRGVIFMLSTLIIGSIGIWLVNRKKKGEKYV